MTLLDYNELHQSSRERALHHSSLLQIVHVHACRIASQAMQWMDSLKSCIFTATPGAAEANQECSAAAGHVESVCLLNELHGLFSSHKRTNNVLVRNEQ